MMAILLAALVACGIPRGAALQSEIVAQKRGVPADFAVYPVTRSELPRIASWTGPDLRPKSWIGHSHGAAQVILPGDVIDLVVWDSDTNSLLSTADRKSADLQGVLVGRDGMIFVPYLEKIRVAGLSPDAARARIQEQMLNIAPSAQVQLQVTPGARQRVDVVSGVTNPGSYPLDDPDGHSSVLGMISRAGGVSPNLRNPQVTLTRNGRSYVISLDKLYENPALDSVMRGRDKLIVTEDERYFRALGASSKEAIIPFDRAAISALDALSMIEGLQNGRADPKGILILRQYDASLVRTGGPSHQRTIFSVDLTTADGLFSAGEFQILPGDTIVATEAPTVAAGTIISLFSGTFQALSRAKAL